MIKDKNVKNGWKNRPGNSFKHFALSLNSAAIKLMRFRNMHERNNRIICKIRKLESAYMRACARMCKCKCTYSYDSSDNGKSEKCSFISDSFFKKLIWIRFV